MKAKQMAENYQPVQSQTKLKTFEYLIDTIIEKKNGVYDDLSKLKIIKILFFIVSASIKIDPINNLLKIFDKFYALKYGHVELDIYNEYIVESMLEGSNKKFKISDSNMVINDKYIEIDTTLENEDSTKDMIKSAVNALLKENSNIFNYKPFELVELSHLHYSWHINNELRKELKLRMIEIPHIDIIDEEKYFNLNN